MIGRIRLLRNIESMFFEQNPVEPFARDAAVTERLPAGGMIRRPAPVPWREHEVRALSRMLGLPQEWEVVMQIDAAVVRDSESVRRWFSSRQGLWGSKSVTDDLVETLARFCPVAGKTPDETIDECLRPGKDREVFTLRTRARLQYVDQIEGSEAQEDSRDEANVVRSFFIHNGVAMNPSILV